VNLDPKEGGLDKVKVVEGRVEHAKPLGVLSSKDLGINAYSIPHMCERSVKGSLDILCLWGSSKMT
jgi:hypothetical protein